MNSLKRMERERNQRIRVLAEKENVLAREALKRGLSLGLALSTVLGAGGLEVSKKVDNNGRPQYGIEWKMNSAKADSYCDDQTMAEVEAKAQLVFDYCTQANVINFETGNPYTYEEIVDRILMINGLYLPSSDEEAYQIPMLLTNFACSPLNAQSTLLTVNYMAQSDAISEDQVKAAVNAAPIPNWTDLLLVGDSYCKPYLEWLGAKCQAMFSTTNRAEFIAIFNEIMDSLVAMVYRDGFELNGVVYRDIDFLGQDKVAVGNVLQFLVYYSQVGYVEGVKVEYDSTSVLSGPAVVYLETLLQHFSGACTADEFMGAYEHNDAGQLVPRQGDNFNQRTNVNTINSALTNRMLDGLSR